MDGITRDITERRLRNRKIAQLSRVSALLTGIIATLTRVHAREELFREACRIAAEGGGFGMVWAGVFDADAGLLRAVAHHGFTPGVALDFGLPRDGLPAWESGTATRAIHERRPVVVNDIAAEASRNEACSEALRRGYRAVIALPLQIGERVDGLMFMFAREPGFFDAAEVELLTEFARTISVALAHIDREEKLRYLAQYDVLTGLPNRALFQERLAALLEHAVTRGTQTVLAIVNISRFRSINETFGRSAADALLRELAHRLRRAWPDVDGVARLTADDFALLLPATQAQPDAVDIQAVLQRCLQEALAAPFSIEGSEIRITMTAGVAVCPPDGRDAESLLRNAEAAQRRAREAGETILFYRRDMNARVADKLLLETRLRRAIDLQQFELHYQPKYATISGALTGFEALLRWRDPSRGLVQPARFIAILEETGMVLEAGAWAMQQALRTARNWPALPDGRAARVAVNVSPIQFRQRGFQRVVRQAMEESRGRHGLLDLEITETTLMQDIEENAKTIVALREMGVNVAVDDFGTGYSSLGYLARLPVNALKIERSFIETMTGSAYSLALVSMIISLARSLDLTVIAEGVETHEQLKLLRLLKCDHLQGYLFSRPLSAAQVPGLFDLVARLHATRRAE